MDNLKVTENQYGRLS